MKRPKMSLWKTVFSLKCHLPNAKKPSNYGLFCSNAVRTLAPRRRGLRIVRDDDFSFRINAIAHSLRRSSSPNWTRFAGLQFGFVFFAKYAQLRFRQQPEAIAENCVRFLAPPSKSEAQGFGFVFSRFSSFPCSSFTNWTRAASCGGVRTTKS